MPRSHVPTLSTWEDGVKYIYIAASLVGPAISSPAKRIHKHEDISYVP